MTYPSNYRCYNYIEDCDNEDDSNSDADNEDDDDNNNNNEFDDGDSSEENKEFEACDCLIRTQDRKS